MFVGLIIFERTIKNSIRSTALGKNAKRGEKKTNSVSISSELFGLKCSRSEMKTRKRSFSGTKFLFPFPSENRPKKSTKSSSSHEDHSQVPKELPSVSRCRYCRKLLKNFAFYRHVTEELTVNEILHVQQKTTKPYYIVLQVRQQSDFRWITGYCKNTEGSIMLHPQNGKIKTMKSNRVQYKNSKVPISRKKRTNNRKIILLSLMHDDNGTREIIGKEQFNPCSFMSEQNHFTHI